MKIEIELINKEWIMTINGKEPIKYQRLYKAAKALMRFAKGQNI